MEKGMIHRIVNSKDVVTSSKQDDNSIKDLNKLRQNSFIQILNDRLQPDEISFSAHALSRLEQRNIVVDEKIKAQLEEAIEKIALKGGKESVIMLENVAYLVSIPNKKIITALSQCEENLFTNIDSAYLSN
jgi:flagellar operon protein